MIGELRTIIRRDGSYERFEGLQQTDDSLGTFLMTNDE